MPRKNKKAEEVEPQEETQEEPTPEEQPQEAEETQPTQETEEKPTEEEAKEIDDDEEAKRRLEEAESPEPTKPTASFVLSSKRADLEAFLKPISTLTDEPIFTVSGEGLSLRQMDPSRVAMVDFHYRMQNLESFQAVKEGQICFNLTELLKIIRRAGKDDEVTLTSNPELTQLTVDIKGKYARRFTLPVLEPESETPPVPKFSPTVKVKTTIEHLRSVMEDSKLVSDHLSLIAHDEAVKFLANGDLMSHEADWRKGDEALLDIEAPKEETKAIFSLSYLTDMVKAVDKDTIATVEFGKELPMRLDVSNGVGKLVYYLAPRIEVD